MQKSVKRSISTLMLLFLSCTPALSDKGLIFVRLTPGSDTGDSAPVKFFEPNQNAIIAFDGDEEILYLSTNLRAERSAKVLEAANNKSERSERSEANRDDLRSGPEY
jgi:hypothetical protein